MFGFGDDEERDEKEEAPRKRGRTEDPIAQLLGVLKEGMEHGKVEIRGGEMPPELRRLLESGSETKHTDRKTVQSTKESARRLKQLFANYNKTTDHKPGDLVQWKEGMQNRKVPDYGQPAIVVECLPPGHIDTTVNSGDISYREPLTHRIGFLSERDGEFLVFTYDSARFEPYEG